MSANGQDMFLASKLADFFFFAGVQDMSKCSGALPEQTDLVGRERWSAAGALPLTTAKDSVHFIGTPFRIQFESFPCPTLLGSYPDHEDHASFPKHAAMFCFPAGHLDLVRSLVRPEPQFHVAVITDQYGVRNYICCLKVFEPLSRSEGAWFQDQLESYRKQHFSESDLEYIDATTRRLELEWSRHQIVTHSLLPSDSIEEHLFLLLEQLRPFWGILNAKSLFSVYKAKCVGLISKWPFFGPFHDWLSQVYRLQLREDWTCPLERMVLNLVEELPLPPPGKTEVVLRLDDLDIKFSRPPVNCIATCKSFSSLPLFAVLSLESIVRIFEYVVAEKKILFISEHELMLAIACESFCSFLYPLYWQHVYVPVLPSKMMMYLHAPVPFMVGLTLANLNGHDIPDDVMVVRLDEDMVHFPKPDRPSLDSLTNGVPSAIPFVPRLPAHHRLKLSRRLEKFSRWNRKDWHDVRDLVRWAVSRPWSSTEYKKETMDSYHLVQIRSEIVDARTSFKNALDRYKKTALASRQPVGRPKSLKEAGSKLAPSTFLSKSRRASVSIETTVPAPPSAGSLFSVSEKLPDNVAISKCGSMTMSSTRDHDEQTDKSSFSTVHTANTHDSRSSPSRPPSLSNFAQHVSGMIEFAKMRIQASNSKQEADSFSSSTDSFHTAQGVPVDLPPIAPPKSLETDQSPATSLPNVDGTEEGRMTNSFEEEIYRSFCLEFNPDARRKHISHEETSPSVVHLSMANRHAYPWVVCSSDLPSDTLLLGRNEKLTTFRGHSFQSILLAFQVPLNSDLECEFEPPNYISLGICGACHQTVHISSCVRSIERSTNSMAPMLRLSRSGISMASLAIPLACNRCGLVLHQQCNKTALESCSLAFSDVKVQEAFLATWTSILRNYSNYIGHRNSDRPRGTSFSGRPDGTKVASKGLIAGGQAAISNYIHSRRSSKSERSSLEGVVDVETWLIASTDRDHFFFMKSLLETQSFAQFAHHRVQASRDNFEVILFDECIKRKLNRSKIRLQKDATPFIADTSYRLAKTFLCELKVSKSSACRSQKKDCSRMPDTLQKHLFPVPEPYEPLVTEMEAMRVKIHTSAILQRIKFEKRAMTDVTDWLKLRLTKTAQPPSQALYNVDHTSVGNEPLQSSIEKIYKRFDLVLKRDEDVFHSRSRPASPASNGAGSIKSTAKKRTMTKGESEAVLKMQMQTLETLRLDIETLRDRADVECREELTTLRDQVQHCLQSHSDRIRKLDDSSEEGFAQWCERQLAVKKKDLGLTQSTDS